MKICLYRAFPDAYRQSMTLYADELVKNLRPLLKKGDDILDYLPDSIKTEPVWRRYVSQYVTYQLAASRMQADIHHITDHSYAHLLHSLPQAQSVITFHDAIGLENQTGIGRRALRHYNMSALKKAGAIIFDSRASRNALLQRMVYPENRTFLVYPGIDSAFFGTLPKNPFEILGIPEGLYLLHVGHTGIYKNIPAVFRVLADLRQKGLNIRLLKTGTPFTDSQNELAESLKIKDSILHLGLVERSQMPAVYRAAQCLLFPSLNEGFGFPVLEAMAAGTPVVCSNRGSLPELSPRADLFFEPKDYYGMSRRIADIITDKTVKESLIHEGKENARRFQWQDTAQKILTVYQKLLQKEL